MKRFFLLIVALLLLTACSNNNVGTMSGGSSKPRIPDKNPSIPSKTLQASILETARYNKDKEEVDMDQLLETINQNLRQPVITKEEVGQGWYYGKKEDEKLGTPVSWVWLDEGSKSRWVSPHSIEEADALVLDDLCTKTGGTYIVSCLEREVEDCQYVTESVCRCFAATSWIESQGCVLMDGENKFIQITPDELRQGWYKGLPSQKKLNTPLSWVWMDNGNKNARWQNPRPH